MLNAERMKVIIKDLVERGIDQEISPILLKQEIVLQTNTVDVVGISRAINSMVNLGVLIGNNETGYRLGSFAYSLIGKQKPIEDIDVNTIKGGNNNEEPSAADNGPGTEA
jgi:hypothetical protein